MPKSRGSNAIYGYKKDPEDNNHWLVDEDTWYTVQKIRETKHRPIAQGKANPLTGFMFCADCGAKMFNHRTKGYEKKDKDGNPTDECVKIFQIRVIIIRVLQIYLLISFHTIARHGTTFFCK